MSEQELPDWVQPGQRVAVWKNSYSSVEVDLVLVERHTKTQIVLSNGDKYRKEFRGVLGDFRRVGDVSSYGSRRSLRDPESPEVKKALLETQIRTQATALLRYAERLQKNPDMAHITAIINAANKVQELLEVEQA